MTSFEESSTPSPDFQAGYEFGLKTDIGLSHFDGQDYLQYDLPEAFSEEEVEGRPDFLEGVDAAVKARIVEGGDPAYMRFVHSE